MNRRIQRLTFLLLLALTLSGQTALADATTKAQLTLADLGLTKDMASGTL